MNEVCSWKLFKSNASYSPFTSLNLLWYRVRELVESGVGGRTRPFCYVIVMPPGVCTYFKLDGSGWAFITWPVPNVSFTTRRYFCSTDQQLSWFAVNFSLLRMRCSWPFVENSCLVSFLSFSFALCGIILFCCISVFSTHIVYFLFT